MMHTVDMLTGGEGFIGLQTATNNTDQVNKSVRALPYTSRLTAVRRTLPWFVFDTAEQALVTRSMCHTMYK